MMKRTPTWRASPRARRAIAETMAALSPEHSHLALMVGAGVDSGLRSRPGWTKLVEKLAIGGGIDPGAALALANVANRWPLEAAEALRGAVGFENYNRAIKEFVSTRKSEQTVLANALKEFVRKGVRVILSFNYTSDLVDLLQTDDKRNVRVIQRADLSAWNPQQLLTPPADHIHVIALHGYVDPHSSHSPDFVLDRHSYDAAVQHSPYYQQLLTRLFQDFTVLTFGLSWTDVPLRNIAAQVLFEFPIAAKVHAAVLSHGTIEEDIWQERAFVNSYSVRPLYYDVRYGSHVEGADLLQTLAKDVPVVQVTSRASDLELRRVAHMLDAWGDYESGPQCDWMAEHWRDLRDAMLDRPADSVDVETWLALARIERHLRHFLWFYLPQKDQRTRVRRILWERVASLAAVVPGIPLPGTGEFIESLTTGILDGAESRGIFEFAIGAFEVQYEANVHELSTPIAQWQSALREFARRHPGSIPGQRIELAMQLWRPEGLLTRSELEHLRARAICCQWEGIESKIVLDIAQAAFKTARNTESGTVPRRWREDRKREILIAAEDARVVARTAGCLRREVGAVIVGSFVAPIAAAESSLLAILHRFRIGRGRGVELSMLWWIYTGLIAVFVDTRGREWAGPAEARQWLQRRCGKLEGVDGHIFEAVTKNSIPHWAQFHPDAAKLATEIMS